MKILTADSFPFVEVERLRTDELTELPSPRDLASYSSRIDELERALEAVVQALKGRVDGDNLDLTSLLGTGLTTTQSASQTSAGGYVKAQFGLDTTKRITSKGLTVDCGAIKTARTIAGSYHFGSNHFASYHFATNHGAYCRTDVGTLSIPFRAGYFTNIFADDREITDAVTGPASAVDNELARFDATTGKLVQGGSGWVLSDGGVMAIADNDGISNASSDSISWATGILRFGIGGVSTVLINATDLSAGTSSIDLGNSGEPWDNAHLTKIFLGGVDLIVDRAGAGILAVADASANEAQIDVSGLTANRAIVIQDVAGTNALTLDTYGLGTIPVVAKTGAYTTTANDCVINVDASGGAVTITLVALSGLAGKVFHIKKTDSSANAVTIDANGDERIDTATTLVITNQYDSVMLVGDADETNWGVH